MVTSVKTQLWTFNWILQDALMHFHEHDSTEIYTQVRFFSNPAISYAFPGKTTLRNHKCLHVLLDLGMDDENEVFVLGFAMGNDTRNQPRHLALFKFFSRFIGPSHGGFSQQELDFFERGFLYGKSLPTQNLNSLNFERFYPHKVGEVRAFLDIWLDEVQCYHQGLIQE